MNENIELDLRGIFKALLKRAWIIVLCAVILATSVCVYTMNFVTPKYEASVTMYVNNNTGKNSNNISSSDLAVALRLVSTYVNIIQSNKVLEKVIAETGISLSVGQVRGMISAEVVDETEMFRVRVSTSNPQVSADIANAIAAVAPGEISEIIEGSSAKVIDYARVPTSRSSPNYVSSAMLGAVAGAVLAAAVIVLCAVLDTRIKHEEDLKKICDVPVLGVIPDISVDKKKQGRK